LSPGPLGAHNWQPMSYSPLTGLVYIPGQESASIYNPDPNFEYKPGYWNTGLALGRRPPLPSGATPAPRPAAVPEPEGADKEPKATGRFLVAWDPVAEKERWRIVDNGPRVPGAYAAIFGGGTLATAGNLVFQGAAAFNAQTGEKLWQADLGGLNVTPVTYVLDGKQYLSLLGGPTVGSRLYTFVIDGKEPMPGTAKLTSIAPAPTAANAAALVNRVCASCHAVEVVTNSKLDRQSWKETVDNMVARGAIATPQEMSVIVDYLAKNFGTN